MQQVAIGQPCVTCELPYDGRPEHQSFLAGARETIRFLPPLNVSKSEVDQALAILEGAFEDVFGTTQHVPAEPHTKGRAGS